MVFSAEIGRHPAQICRGTEQQGRKDRRTHDDVRDREFPASGFALDSADVKSEANHAIDQSDEAYPAHWTLRHSFVKYCSDTRDAHQTLRITGVYMTGLL